MRYRRNLKRAIVVIAIAVCAVVAIRVWRVQANRITGTDWLIMQEEYIGQLGELADMADNVTALYVTGSIAQSDYVTHLNELSAQLLLIEKGYERDAAAVDVKNGTNTEESVSGTSSVKECFSIFSEMCEGLAAASGDANMTAYAYLAYGQRLTDAVSGYESAVNLTYLNAMDADGDGTLSDEELADAMGGIYFTDIDEGGQADE